MSTIIGIDPGKLGGFARVTYRPAKLTESAALWRGIAYGLRYRVAEVAPAKWKRSVGLPVGATKNDSRLRAMELYPEVAASVALVKDDGRAEALLVAHYGRTQLL